MSLSSIYNFQKHIFKLLSQNEYVSKYITKIHLGAIQDGKAPFLIINITKIEDLSSNYEPIYSIEFQIVAYAKDHNYRALSQLSHNISLSLNLLANDANRNFNQYCIAGIKQQDLKFDKAKDLVLNKLTINYKSLIKTHILMSS